MNSQVQIYDVAMRDGLQSESRFVPTADKIALIDALSATGLPKIEATSFTSPRAIPNLSDATEVMQGIFRRPDVIFSALVPNLKGCERAIACGVDEINLVMSASDSHSRANLRMTSEQSLQQFSSIIESTRGQDVLVNASLSTAFGCPFDGPVPEDHVLGLVERLIELGIQGITLCDTTGMANPRQVSQLCGEVASRYPGVPVTLHAHNTRGMGLANMLAGWHAGITRFDASLGGLGGCPYAPGATGNVCTEDAVHMFEQMGITTGIDLDALLEVAKTLPDHLGHDVPGQVLKAGKSDRRYPLTAEPCR